MEKEILEYLGIKKMFVFEDKNDIELIGDIKKYEYISKNGVEIDGDDFDILLQYKESNDYSLISFDTHSLQMYFYEDAKDYYDHIRDDIATYKESLGEYSGFSFSSWIKEDFGVSTK